MGVLSDIEAKLEEKKNLLVPKSGWGSRKLWIFAGIAFAMVWLGRGNLALILDGLIYLTGVYLITQAAHDIVSDAMTAWVQRQKIRSDAEVQIAQITTEDKKPAATVPTTP